MGHVRLASSAQRRHAAAIRRDGALARLSTITGAVGVATIAAVCILGVYVGKALPGHHAAPATGTTATSAGGTQVPGTSGTSSNGGQGAINPPSTPTQGTSLQPPVTSGSS
jgi:hypothetical protein